MPEFTITQAMLVEGALQQLSDYYLAQQRAVRTDSAHDQQKLSELRRQYSYIEFALLGAQGLPDYLYNERKEYQEPYSGQESEFSKLIEHLIYMIKPEEHKIINLGEMFKQSIVLMQRRLQKDNHLLDKDIKNDWAEASEFLHKLAVSASRAQAKFNAAINQNNNGIATASDSNDVGVILKNAGIMAAHDGASRSEVTEENGGMVVPELDETQKRLVVESLNKIHDKYLQQRDALTKHPHDVAELEKLLHKLSYIQNIILGKKGVYDYLLRGEREWSYATQEEEPYSGQATDFPKLINHLISHIKPEEYEIINLSEIFDESIQFMFQQMDANNNLSSEDIHHYAQASSFLGALDVSASIAQAKVHAAINQNNNNIGSSGIAVVWSYLDQANCA